MARKTKAEKAQIARNDAAARQRINRERVKVGGLTRLHLDPEVYTVNLLTKLAKFTVRPVGALVTELLEAVPVASLRITPRWFTRDCTAQDLEITVPVSVSEALSSHKGLSAGSVLEWLVLERCQMLTKNMIGLADDIGQVVHDYHIEFGGLCYVHPDNVAFVITQMYHVAGGLVYANGKTPYDKYAQRLKYCTDALSRQHVSKEEPYDECAGIEMLQASAISRAQAVQHNLAASAQEEQAAYSRRTEDYLMDLLPNEYPD